MADQLWDVPRFASWAVIPVPSAYRLIAEGKVPGVIRIGPRTIRLDPDTVKEWATDGGLQAAVA